MLKAVLISLAALVSFDAAAWQSQVRTKLVYDARLAIAQIKSLDWTWD